MEQNEEIKIMIKDILGKMNIGFEYLEDVESCIDNTRRFLIKTGESGILIGVEGNNLNALNHIIKEMAWKKIPQDQKMSFFIDVNDYQHQKMQKIKELALEAAKKAFMFKRDVEMSPMSSYERRIVHSVLENESSIFTESDGDGEFRRVVVKFKA